MLSISHLQQLKPLSSYSCPAFVISTNYDSVLVTNGNKCSTVLQFNGNDEYIKTESIRLASSRIVSLSCASDTWVIACTNTGDILAIEWKSIMGIKTPAFVDYNTMDIFASLLDDQINPKSSKLPKLCDSVDSLESVSLSVLQDLNSAYLVDGILIGFTVQRNKAQCCTLNIWKPNHSTAGSSSTLPSFSLQPNFIISHDSTSSPVNDHNICTIPYLSVILYTGQVKENVVSLTSHLFNYLFGSEEALSQSLMIVYGCHCGLVFGCSLKRLYSCFRSNRQKLVTCLDQPVLSIHPFSFSNQTNVYDSILFIGRLGKIVLITSYMSSVSTQEIISNGPLLSSLLIPQQALLLSTLTSVQLICLKCHTDDNSCDDKSRVSSTLLIKLFEQPLTVLYSSYYLLSYNEGRDNFSIIGLRPEGQLCSIKLPFDFGTLLQSETNISSQLKRTIDSIQSSSDLIKQLDSEIASIDQNIVALNEVCSLFGDHLDQLSQNPLNLKMSINYEQLDAITRQPFLSIKLHLLRERSTLRKGCFLNITMIPDAQTHQYNITSSHNICSLSLEGLSTDNPLNLKLTIPPRVFLTQFRFRVLCCLSFSPFAMTTGTSSHRRSPLSIPLADEVLTLVNFVHLLEAKSCDFPDLDADICPIVVKISDSTIHEYLQGFQESSSSNNTSPLFLMLCKLFTTGDVSKSLVSVKDCRGNSGFELRGILPDNSLVKFSLMEGTITANELQYILSITSSLPSHATELADIVSKMLRINTSL